MNQEIANAQLGAGAIGLWWLGGSGFVFKTADGKVILIDPYLSDAVERIHGFKRMVPTPLLAEDARCDAVLCTHEHTDHLDPDAIPVIARSNPDCVFAGPPGCVKVFHDMGIEDARIVGLPMNGVVRLAGVAIHTAPSNHSDLSIDAITPLFDFGDARVLHSGDTSICVNRFQALYDLEPDIILPCINGTFGNMTPTDAAMMAQQSGARIAIPQHFGLITAQWGDPAAFLYACKHFCPEVRVNILRPGEGLYYSKAKGIEQI